MSDEHSVSRHFDGLRDGDATSAQVIWDRYVDQLISLAHRKLKNTSRRFLNEEDVVQDAFENFFRQVRQHRFSRLHDRDDLWQVLAMLVDRKAKDQIKKLNAQKAGNQRVRGDSIAENSEGPAYVDRLSSFLPTSAAAIELAESFEARLNALPSEAHRRVALLKLEGYQNKEISESLGSSLRSVERRLKDIREIWEAEASDDA